MTTSQTEKAESAADSSAAKKPPPRCLTRRVWDNSRAWRDTLVHAVWFWRLGVVMAILAAGVYAWNAPEVGPRAVATALLFTFVVLLGLDLFTAVFNLPLLAFYGLLWCMLSGTSLIDIFFYGRWLSAKSNHIAVLVMFANFALGIAAAVLWFSLRGP
jgi:hypothetical protein